MGDVIPDTVAEQQVFRLDRSAAAARQRLENELETHLAEIDRTCTLSEAQKQKLSLLGRGDIKRFYDRFERLKRLSHTRGRGDQHLIDALERYAVLGTVLQWGIFHEESLLYRSLPHTLTDDQWANFQKVQAERRLEGHRRNLEEALRLLNSNTPLKEEQQREFQALLSQEIKPPRRSSSYNQQLVWIQLGRVPQTRLQPLFDDMQWQMVRRLIAQYQRLAPHLKDAGILTDEEADGSL